MAGRKALVVVTRKLPDSVETRMRELFDAQLNLGEGPMAPEAFAEALRTADVLVPTITDRIDAAVIEAAGPRPQLIAHFGNGGGNIDVAGAAKHGLTRPHTPGGLTPPTAHPTPAPSPAVAPRPAGGATPPPPGPRGRWSPTWMLGHRINGKRLGIVGMGRIGQALAKRARAFGLSVHYHNRRRVAPALETALEATWWDSLDQMLARMDIVSVNCPHTPATFHLLSARRLKLMKPSAILVNTARGEIIDEKALIGMLETNALAGAGLDVFEHAPAVAPKLVRLAKAGKVTLLPHMGSATYEGRVEMGEKVIINVKAFLDGHKPPDRVLPSAL